MPRLPAALIFLVAAFLTALSFNATAAVISTYAGGGFSAITNGLPATNAALPGVQGLATDLLGNLFLADASAAVVRRVDPTNGLLTAVAGNGTYGSSGDGGPAVEATLSTPASVAVDLTGNLYLCDPSGGDLGIGSVRKVDGLTGVITSLVGDASGPAMFPNGIAVDVHGNLYVADYVYNVVRKRDAATGFFKNIAGHSLTPGHSGDGGFATNALLNFPVKIAVDAADNVFILDQGPPTYVRRIDGVTGIITTIAGGGAGASGLATNVSLDINANGFTAIAEDLAVDNLGSLYLGGWSQVWKVDLATGGISIIAGAGGTNVGFWGDGGPATNALLSYVTGLAVSGPGDLYLTDGGNGRVRRITPDTVPPFNVLVDLTVSQSCLPVQTQVRSNLYLATVNGRLALVLPNGINAPGDVLVINNTTLSANMVVPVAAAVGGNLTISGNTSSTLWDLSQLTHIGGALTFLGNGSASLTVGNTKVNGGLTASTTAGGAITIGSPAASGLSAATLRQKFW